MSDGPRPSARLEPGPAWTVLTDSPLAGLGFAREAGAILAWDDGDQLYLLDLQGDRQTNARAEARILQAAISDDGQLVAVLVEGGRLFLLGRDLEPLGERSVLTDPIALAVDPHGRYVAVSSKLSATAFYSRHARAAGKLATLTPLAHLRFVPDRPLLLGASAYGAISGFALEPGGSAGGLEAEEIWRQQPMSNIGRLTCSGDGGLILASCFTHGIQRYDVRGHNEGSYHLGGTVAHAVPDFAGRVIAVATTEGELAILNRGGNVRWKTALPRPIIALEVDALGRFLIYGVATGEITRLDLDAPTGRKARSRPAVADVSVPPDEVGRPGAVRQPDWSAPVANSDDEAETAVLCVLDDPPRIGVYTRSNRLQVFTTAGGALGQSLDTIGVGRILRTAPGWIAAATDRMIVLYDARRNGSTRVDLSLVEVTHLVARPDTYGLAIVQERDRIGRATVAGRWVWRRELRQPVEDLAVGLDGRMAVSDDAGQILVFDPAGEPAGTFQAEPVEPLCLVEAPEGSPAGVAWVSLARRHQVLRGHRADGRAVWESPIPWESWQLSRIGPLVVVSAPDGRAIAYDGSGHARGQSRAEAGPGVVFAAPDDTAWRVAKQGPHLICTDLPGRVKWRAVADAALGPVAAGRAGVAALIGRSLAWFASPEPA